VTIARGQATATIVNDDSSTWVSGTFADLTGGTTGTGAYVAEMSDGAVILQPRLTQEFTAGPLPEGWTKSPAGTLTFAGGAALIDGAQIQNTTGLYGNQTVEFVATFNGASQYMGTAQLRFNTKADGLLYATTLAPKNATIEAVLPANLVGSAHRFRIDWLGNTITYAVDGTIVAIHTAAFPSTTQMMALGGDLGAGVLSLDWVRMTPYAPSGEFTSAVFDAGQVVGWNTASWVSELPAGTGLTFQVRIGAADGTWSPFTAVGTSGGAITGSAGRYAQYRVLLTTTTPGSTPALKDVAITFTR
jgi:large repetitive protein